MPRPPLFSRSAPGTTRYALGRRHGRSLCRSFSRLAAGRESPLAGTLATASLRAVLLSVLLFAAVGPAAAAPGAFTTAGAFAAAVPGSVATFDFESVPGGTDVSGTTLAVGVGGITLPGPLADVLDPGGPALSLRVVVDGGDNPASSGSRSLGVGDPGNFDAIVAGTTLAFSFPEPVLAFGLTIITPEEPGAAFFDDDLLLLVPGESTASLTLSDGEPLGTFGGRAYRSYFLGVVGAAAFSSARLETGGATPPSGFLYNVDDLRIPLPEPGAASGLLGGSAFLLLLGRRRPGPKSDRSLEPALEPALDIGPDPGPLPRARPRTRLQTQPQPRPQKGIPMPRRTPTFQSSPLSPGFRAGGSVLARLVGLIAFSVLVASPALAQRPSLLELQAAVEGLVSPVPPAAVGEIRLQTVGGGSEAELRLGLVDLAFPVQRSISGGAGGGTPLVDFDPVRVTVPQSASGALLSARLVSGAPQTVRVFVPDVDSPRDLLEVLVLQNAVLQKVEDAALPGRIAFELSYETVTFTWGGTDWGWNLVTNAPISGVGCGPAAIDEAHVDLAGNAAAQLQAGEIESTHRLVLAPPPAPPVFSYTRKPANACYMRAITSASASELIDATFDRLWSQDELFGGRQSVETIDFAAVFLRSWTLRIASGEVLEDVELPLVGSQGFATGTGGQTLRDFDPATGAETSAESVVFLDVP